MVTTDNPINVPFDPSTGRTISTVNFFHGGLFPPRHTTAVRPLVCGEIAFEEVRKALLAARESINISFWGLDPAMVLRRGTATTFNTDDILGEILLRKAREGKKVKVIIWDSPFQAVGSGSGGEPEMTSERDGGNNENLGHFLRAAADEDNLEVVLTPHFGRTSLFPSYHQKTIIIDIETPQNCNAFVLGHNMLVNYWSTTSLIPTQPRREFYLRITGFGGGDLAERVRVARENYEFYRDYPSPPVNHDAVVERFRTEYEDLRAQLAASGGTHFSYRAESAPAMKPYLDVSSQLWGTGVVDVYDNFCRVWKLNERRSFGGMTPMDPLPENLNASEYVDRNWNAQVQVASTFTYPARNDIETFYYDAITKANRYVLMVNQYFRYWDLSERIVDALNARQSPQRKKIPFYVVTNNFNAAWAERGHDGECEKIFTDGGIPISLCEMITQEAANRKHIYVHAKLLIVDDIFYTIGSANYNYRSMRGDPELNVGVVHPGETISLRRQIMNMLIGDPMEGLADRGVDPADAMTVWEEKVAANTVAESFGRPLPHGRCIRYNPRLDQVTPNTIVRNEAVPEGFGFG